MSTASAILDTPESRAVALCERALQRFGHLLPGLDREAICPDGRLDRRRARAMGRRLARHGSPAAGLASREILDLVPR